MDRRRFSFAATTICVSVATGQSKETNEARQATGAVKQNWRVGVIGHTGRGNYGHGLDTVWLRLANTDVVGVADASGPGLAKALTKLKLESDAGYRDYREMLKRVRPDIVAVCPRHADQHHDMILAAVEAGVRGIYVEKPFVRTLQEVDRVVAACDQSGTKLAVAHRNRYHPTLRRIDQMIDAGQIGRLLEIRGRGKGDRRGGAEDLWVLGSHVLNLMSYFGGSPKACSATMYQDGRRVVREDVVEGGEGLGLLAGNELHAKYRFGKGITGYFDSIADDGTANHGFGLQLIGSQGIIQIRCDTSPLAHWIPGNPFQPGEQSRPWVPISSAGAGKPEPISDLGERIHQHGLPADDLLAAVALDRQPTCGLKEASETVEMICAVFESHRLGREVELPLENRAHPLSLL